MRRFQFHEAVTLQFGEDSYYPDPPEGLTHEDLQQIKSKFEAAGCSCRFVHLHMLLPEMVRIVQGSRVDAHVLIIRGGVRALLGSPQNVTELLTEQLALPVETGTNLHQVQHSADTDSFSKLETLRSALPAFFPSKSLCFNVEGYRYFDPAKCGFNYQGSNQVISMVLGYSLKVDFNWYHQGFPEGKAFSTSLDHGDLFIMSRKAMGFDWEKPNVYNVQHAMGAQKFRTLPKKKTPKRNPLLNRKRGPRRRPGRKLARTKTSSDSKLYFKESTEIGIQKSNTETIYIAQALQNSQVINTNVEAAAKSNQIENSDPVKPAPADVSVPEISHSKDAPQKESKKEEKEKSALKRVPSPIKLKRKDSKRKKLNKQGRIHRLMNCLEGSENAKEDLSNKEIVVSPRPGVVNLLISKIEEPPDTPGEKVTELKRTPSGRVTKLVNSIEESPTSPKASDSVAEKRFVPNGRFKNLGKTNFSFSEGEDSDELEDMFFESVKPVAATIPKSKPKDREKRLKNYEESASDAEENPLSDSSAEERISLSSKSSDLSVEVSKSKRKEKKAEHVKKDHKAHLPPCSKPVKRPRHNEDAPQRASRTKSNTSKHTSSRDAKIVNSETRRRNTSESKSKSSHYRSENGKSSERRKPERRKDVDESDHRRAHRERRRDVDESENRRAHCERRKQRERTRTQKDPGSNAERKPRRRRVRGEGRSTCV